MLAFLNVELTSEYAKLPTRAHSGDAGLDFYSPIYFRIPPRSDYLLPLDLKVEFPEGFALIFCEKSGVATKKKIDILAKVIDSQYRGVVHAHLYNNSDDWVFFDAGDKVVQGLLIPCWSGQPNLVKKVDDRTSRGQGGFGSSGK